tara:strand:+ start:463 stop:900 length:438 start_codon:yes stop_codon:yes gene_type:complete
LFKRLSFILMAPILFGPSFAQAQEQRELLDCLAVSVVVHKFEVAKEWKWHTEDPFRPKPKSWTFAFQSRVVELESAITGEPRKFRDSYDTSKIVLTNEHDQSYYVEKFEELDTQAQKAFDDGDWDALYDLEKIASHCPKRSPPHK